METGDGIATGVINPDELYTYDAFKRRLGIQDATLRSARRAGLRVCYCHKHAYIYGRDWIDYVLRVGNIGRQATDDENCFNITE